MANEEKTPVDRQLAKIEDMSLDDSQLAEQLYNSAGLNPVVDAGLKDYDKRLQMEDKMITKVFGPRGTDIRGYGESVWTQRSETEPFAARKLSHYLRSGSLLGNQWLPEERNAANGQDLRHPPQGTC
jgi:hypothetical protein